MSTTRYIDITFGLNKRNAIYTIVIVDISGRQINRGNPESNRDSVKTYSHVTYHTGKDSSRNRECILQSVEP